MNLPMFSAKLKLKLSLLIVSITSKSIWKRVLVIRRVCGQTLGRVRVRTVVIIKSTTDIGLGIGT